MAYNFDVEVESFWENGYTIVRDVFTPDEIEEFRTRSFESQGKYGGDLLSNPLMNSVILDGRLVSIARKLLGHDDIVYYGDAAIAIREGFPAWHKDNTDRKDGNAPDWRSPYTQLRFGIYLQDHDKHSGGLNLRHKSHNTVSVDEGRVLQLRTRVGDVGVWSMRASHSAAGTLLKWPLRFYAPDIELAKKLPKWLVAPRDKQRIAVFLALGADDEHLDRYLKYLKTRKYIIPKWQKSVYTDEILEAADKIGLKVRDMHKEIEGDPNVGIHEKWQPQPY